MRSCFSKSFQPSGRFILFRALLFYSGRIYFFIQGALFFLHSAFLFLHSAFLMLHSAFLKFSMWISTCIFSYMFKTACNSGVITVWGWPEFLLLGNGSRIASYLLYLRGTTGGVTRNVVYKLILLLTVSQAAVNFDLVNLEKRYLYHTAKLFRYGENYEN